MKLKKEKNFNLTTTNVTGLQPIHPQTQILRGENPCNESASTVQTSYYHH